MGYVILQHFQYVMLGMQMYQMVQAQSNVDLTDLLLQLAV